MSRAAPTADGAGERTIALNRRVRHEYAIEDTLEAGLVLTGTEIKSIRAGKVNLQDAHARVENGEAWLYNMHIAPYEQGNRFNVDPLR
ncbi:MAG TPA: SsrA-binding protein, partial [Vicinamibacterales bacterium]|nr:SsrA-binding protein [Vicinamibacterales bacterium]